MTWNVVSNTTFAGPVSSGAAGSSLQNGWIDNSGSTWSINSSNYASCVAQSDTAPWNTRCLLRPSAEDTVDLQYAADFQLQSVGSSVPNTWFCFRHNRSKTAATCYLLSVNNNTSNYNVQINTIVSGTIGGQQNSSTITGLTAGTTYTLTCSAVQTNGTTTTISWQINQTAANGGALISSGSFTDTTSGLQNLSGSSAIFVYNSNGGNNIARVVTYTDIAGVATSYTLTGPSTGTVGAASTNFTVTPNGTAASNIIVTPSDSSGGGTFTPTTVTFASGSSAAQTFTYTAASAGAKAISTTNNSSLTNPSNLTYTASTPNILGVTSGAVKFSPGNWKGDTGRGGSVYRQSWNNGAWFSYTWNASTSPTATILLNSSSASNLVSVYLNGVLTDSVAGNANIVLSGVVASAVNVVKVFLRNSTQASRWNNGTNVVQVKGLQLDSGSTAATAPVAQPWGLLVGDSISEGIQANAGSDSEILDYTFLVMQALDQLGYDSGVSACGYSGWLRPGDSAGDVPAYYSVSGSSGGSGGTYADASSRWNKIDNGVSLLDSSSQISSYGSTGTTPSFVLINYMTNECLSASNVSDAQASVTQSTTALRAAAPNALIMILKPFTMLAGTSASFQTYLTALQAGVNAYKAANPSDSKVIYVDLGQTMAATLTAAGIYNTGNSVHPYAPGHALVAPIVAARLAVALAAGIANRWTHH